MKSIALNMAAAAVAVIAAGMLSSAASVPAAAAPATPKVSVTSPSYDAPGAAVSTIITVTNVPAGWSASMTARVGTGATSCDSFQWRHGPGGTSVSQKCYANLPARAGSWTLRGTVTLARAGQRALVYAGTKTIKTQGYVTSAVSASVRSAISKCYNTGKNVQLTFDDGYTSQANLTSILATLKAYNVKGRFFLIGSWSRGHSAMVNQIRAAGHYVENHTNTHPALNQATVASVRSEIANGQKPNSATKLLRPPYGAGAYTTRLYNLAAAQGYRLCHWSSDSSDWSGVSADTIVNKVVRGDGATAPVRAGEPVLLHLTNTQTRNALPTLIRSLRAKGLTFDTLK